MLDTVKINHVQHISFTQSRLTDAVSVILSELLSYEHPSKAGGSFFDPFGLRSPAPVHLRRGMVKMKRVETASLSARRVPLWMEAMFSAMARPRPKPLFSPRESSAR